MRRFDTFITLATKIILTGFMSLMLILVFAQVVFRYFIGLTPFFIDEVSRGLLIWVSFLGASLALRASQHIGVEYFIGKLPENAKQPIKWIAQISVLIFLLFFLYASFRYSLNQTGQNSASLQVSMFWFYLALPFGALLMIFQMIFSFFQGE
jgi:TRAP-type transport system small permease protein